MNDLTQLLNAAASGDAQAANELFEQVYHELRRLAAQKMAREAPGHTLQATALVHEAWLRIGGDQQPLWQNRAHFFKSAAEAMRRILVDQARRKSAQRRGGNWRRINKGEQLLSAEEPEDKLLAVHEALDKFALVDPVKAELVKLRYFVGLKITEAAAILGISEPTAKRHWKYARAWLAREIDRDKDDS
jgi:RNA polymerase sigma factor (TIGR02999 family)